MTKIDFLKPYISNKFIRIFIYLMLFPVAFFIAFAFWYVILGVGVIYLAYNKIQDEKTKWTVISTITIALIIAGIFFNKSLGESNNRKEIETSAKEITKREEKQPETPTTQNNQIPQNTQNQTNISENKVEEFLVTRVVDGDTIEIEGGKKVRYIGIDTPETVDPNRPIGCYGKEASNKNSELVLNKKVRLVKDVSETDRYGRLLRYVYVGDTFVNDYLVKEGYAKASTYAPDVKFSEQFAASEREARENKRGLWGSACEVSVAPTITPSTVAPAPTVAQAPAVAPVVAPAPVIQKESSYSGGSSNSGSGIVKKSTTGICHAPGTTYYNKTKNYTAYETVEDCLNSGGRLPKR